MLQTIRRHHLRVLHPTRPFPVPFVRTRKHRRRIVQFGHNHCCPFHPWLRLHTRPRLCFLLFWPTWSCISWFFSQGSTLLTAMVEDWYFYICTSARFDWHTIYCPRTLWYLVCPILWPTTTPTQCPHIRQNYSSHGPHNTRQCMPMFYHLVDTRQHRPHHILGYLLRHRPKKRNTYHRGKTLQCVSHETKMLGQGVENWSWEWEHR